MGMFDEITIDPDFFIMPDQSLEDPYETRSWQTKDLENCLLQYEIDEDGKLFLGKSPVKNPPKTLSMVGDWYGDFIEIWLTLQYKTKTYRVSEIRKYT